MAGQLNEYVVEQLDEITSARIGSNILNGTFVPDDWNPGGRFQEDLDSWGGRITWEDVGAIAADFAASNSDEDAERLLHASTVFLFSPEDEPGPPRIPQEPATAHLDGARACDVLTYLFRSESEVNIAQFRRAVYDAVRKGATSGLERTLLVQLPLEVSVAIGSTFLSFVFRHPGPATAPTWHLPQSAAPIAPRMITTRIARTLSEVTGVGWHHMYDSPESLLSWYQAYLDLVEDYCDATSHSIAPQDVDRAIQQLSWAADNSQSDEDELYS